MGCELCLEGATKRGGIFFGIRREVDPVEALVSICRQQLRATGSTPAQRRRLPAMTSDLYGDLRHTPPPLDVPDRVLAIGAHPDDIEFGAGGTLARWAADGADITMLIVTDGSKGTWEPDRDPAQLAAERQQEQVAAAATLGAGRVIHLAEVDGELEVSMRLRERLCLAIRRAQPDVLLTHDPWQRYQLHPDHRATGTVALDAVVAARDPLFFPDQGINPHRPAAVLLWLSLIHI